MTTREWHLAAHERGGLEPDHNHPTFGVCTCGHLDFMHPWTAGERVNYQGACAASVNGGPCGCEVFHADTRGETA
jgi:hypothetical protein